jgi:hypothetical protein
MDSAEAALKRGHAHQVGESMFCSLNRPFRLVNRCFAPWIDPFDWWIDSLFLESTLSIGELILCSLNRPFRLVNWFFVPWIDLFDWWIDALFLESTLFMLLGWPSLLHTVETTHLICKLWIVLIFVLYFGEPTLSNGLAMTIVQRGDGATTKKELRFWHRQRRWKERTSLWRLIGNVKQSV